ncbi:hypothetical protein PCE1_003131 [Barthelona sp. PCE]
MQKIQYEQSGERTSMCFFISLFIFILLIFFSADRPSVVYERQVYDDLLGKLDVGPHMAGTPAYKLAHNNVLEYYQSLQNIYPQLEIENEPISGYEEIIGRNISFKGLRNIAVRIPGTKSNKSKAILLSGHLDSVDYSPGVSDDGVAVISMMSLASKLLVKPIEVDVIILHSEGEEVGLMGAHVFTKYSKWKDDIAFAVNLDALGSESGQVLFRVTGPTSSLVALHNTYESSMSFLGLGALHASRKIGYVKSITDTEILKENYPTMDYVMLPKTRFTYHSRADSKKYMNFDAFALAEQQISSILRSVTPSQVNEIANSNEKSDTDVDDSAFMGISTLTIVIVSIICISFSLYIMPKKKEILAAYGKSMASIGLIPLVYLIFFNLFDLFDLFIPFTYFQPKFVYLVLITMGTVSLIAFSFIPNYRFLYFLVGITFSWLTVALLVFVALVFGGSSLNRIFAVVTGSLSTLVTIISCLCFADDRKMEKIRDSYRLINDDDRVNRDHFTTFWGNKYNMEAVILVVGSGCLGIIYMAPTILRLLPLLISQYFRPILSVDAWLDSLIKVWIYFGSFVTILIVFPISFVMYFLRKSRKRFLFSSVILLIAMIIAACIITPYSDASPALVQPASVWDVNNDRKFTILQAQTPISRDTLSAIAIKDDIQEITDCPHFNNLFSMDDSKRKNNGKYRYLGEVCTDEVDTFPEQRPTITTIASDAETVTLRFYAFNSSRISVFGEDSHNLGFILGDTPEVVFQYPKKQANYHFIAGYNGYPNVYSRYPSYISGFGGSIDIPPKFMYIGFSIDDNGNVTIG